jgi:hypothetical protein
MLPVLAATVTPVAVGKLGPHKNDRLCDQRVPRLTAEVGLPNLSMICQALSQAYQARVMVLRAHQVSVRQALALPMGMGMGLERTPASDAWAAQVAHR